MWRRVVSASAAAVLATSTGCLGAAAAADPASGDSAPGGRTSTGDQEFYQPPSPLPPGGNGDVLRTEPSKLAYALPWANGKQLPASAKRLMYRSTDTHGNPVATTGTYFDPTTPWTGPGPRPLVVVAPGTQGQGDQCAPSKLVNVPFTANPPGGPMVEYEMSTADALLARGYAVVLPDYEGLGTPGTHTYVNRLAEAHAVLDAARAAQQLPNTQLPPHARVGLWGYSQGGGAAAAAAEQAAGYAPDLDVKGTYAGAPPADLGATLKQADGGALAGVIGYTLNGMSAAYPQLRPTIQQNINDAGKKMLSTVADQCTGATSVQYGYHSTEEYTASGKPLSDMLPSMPEAEQVLADNKIGNGKPSAPALVVSGSSDDIVPHGQAEQLANDWKAKGAQVQFQSVPQPPVKFLRSGLAHVLGDVPGLFAGMGWMDQQFAK